MDALYSFLTSNVLHWIERLAKFGDVHHVTRAASNIQAFLERRAKYYPPFGLQVQTVEAWVIDLIRISAKFKNILVTLPVAIHWLIPPPVCPRESIIYKTYTSPHRGLLVQGLTSTTWDDGLLQIDYRDSQATAVNYGQQLFAVGLSTGLVVLYTADSGRYRSTLIHGERVRLVEFGNRDKIIASSGFRKIRLWDLSDGTQLWSFDTRQQTLSIVFSDENDYMMAASQGNRVNCWNLEQNGEPETISWEGKDGDTSPRRVQRQPPTHVSFSPDHDLIAVAYRGLPILLFNLESGTFFGNCARHAGQKTFEPVVDMSFNPNAGINLLVVSYHDGALALYNPLKIELLHEIPSVNAHTLTCSPDGRTLVTGSAFGAIRVYDFGGANGANLTLLYRINASEEGIRSIAFSNDNLRFVDIRGGQCCVWEPAVLIRKDCEGGSQSDLSDPVSLVPKTVGTAEMETKTDITSMVCHPAGEFVFCGLQDGTVAIYSTKDGQRGSTLYHHANGISVTAIAFGEKSSVLVSADEAGRVLSRNLTYSGREWSVKFLADKRASGAINGLLINPENDYILASGYKTAEIWTVAGELVGKSPTNFLHLEQVLQDPHQPDRFLVIERSTTSSYFWEDFQPVEIYNKVLLKPDEYSGRSITTTFYGPNYLNNITKSYGNKVKSTLQFYRPTIFNDPEVSPAPLPGYEILGPWVEHFISITENKLLFINTDLWVCSLDLKTFAATQEVKRHFFIPSDWQVASGDMMISVTAKKDFVLVKRSELVIISRGLDFSDVFTLSGVPKNVYR